MSIDVAITNLQAEVDSFQQGTKLQPKNGTADWFRLRALSLGLSHLKRIKQLGVHSDPEAAERFYRACSNTFKSTEVPPADVIVKETVPV